jgi:hypothetical protein
MDRFTEVGADESYNNLRNEVGNGPMPKPTLPNGPINNEMDRLMKAEPDESEYLRYDVTNGPMPKPVLPDGPISFLQMRNEVPPAGGGGGGAEEKQLNPVEVKVKPPAPADPKI